MCLSPLRGRATLDLLLWPNWGIQTWSSEAQWACHLGTWAWRWDDWLVIHLSPNHGKHRCLSLVEALQKWCQGNSVDLHWISVLAERKIFHKVSSVMENKLPYPHVNPGGRKANQSQSWPLSLNSLLCKEISCELQPGAGRCSSHPN